MTEKRFENRLSKNNLKFMYQNPVWDNLKEDALNVFEMIDLLNELNDENKTLKKAMGFREDDNDKDIVNVLNLQQRTIVEMVEFIKQLTNKEGKIVLMNGVSYDVQKILGDLE